jgi:hypothetical protein
MKRRMTKKLALRPRIPVPPEMNLTEDEQALLSMPGYMTEDEDDIIASRRAVAEAETTGDQGVPFEDVLKENGLKAVRIHGRVRIVRSRRRANAG